MKAPITRPATSESIKPTSEGHNVAFEYNKSMAPTNLKDKP